MGQSDRNSSSARKREASRSPPRSAEDSGLSGNGDCQTLGVAASTLLFPPMLSQNSPECPSVFSPQDFDAIWDKKLAESGDKLFDSVKSPIEGLVKGVVKEACGLLDQRLGRVEQGVAQMVQGQSSLEQAVADLSKEVKELKVDAVKRQQSEQLPNVPQNNGNPFPTVTNMGGFFRTPDPCVLFVNTFDLVKVSRTKFHNSFLALAVEANLDDSSFNVEGDPLDNRFDIKFLGDFRTASANCHQFYSSLQLGRGRWKKQVCLSDLNSEVQYFVGPDKNAAQIRKEVLAKNLKTFVQGLLQGKEVWIKKETGTLLVDRRRLLSVLVVSESEARIDWAHPKRIELRLDQAQIELEFKNMLGQDAQSRS